MTGTSHSPSRSALLRDSVEVTITSIQQRFISGNDPSARAQLANLRRGDPALPGADPRVWSITLANVYPALQGRDDEISEAERAIHACLVLYALHQQSQSGPAHVPGGNLGNAVRKLARARGLDGQLDGPSMAKLHQVALAPDWSGRIHHIRSLILLMRSENPLISLDYAQLAVDLWRLADPRQDSNQVLNSWGRGLHTSLRNDHDLSGEQK